MRNLLIGAAAVAATAVVAPLAQAQPVLNWTGYYVGVNGGYGWGDGGGDGTVFPSSVPLAHGWVINAPAPGPYGFSVGDPKGGFGGLQIGRNWQSDRFVYGIEADFDFASIKGDGSAPIRFDVNDPGAGIFVGHGNAHAEAQLVRHATWPLGYDLNPLLIYVTGGLAVGHIKSTLDLTGATFSTGGGTPVFVGATSSSASTSSTHLGFAVGAGGEWMVARNWTLRGEYLFMSFSDSGSLAVPARPETVSAWTCTSHELPSTIALAAPELAATIKINPGIAAGVFYCLNVGREAAPAQTKRARPAPRPRSVSKIAAG